MSNLPIDDGFYEYAHDQAYRDAGMEPPTDTELVGYDIPTVREVVRELVQHVKERVSHGRNS